MRPSGRTLRAVPGTGRLRCYGCLPYPRQEAFPHLASNRFPGLRGPYTDMKSALLGAGLFRCGETRIEKGKDGAAAGILAGGRVQWIPVGIVEIHQGA
jgi:hypothetical protein